MEAARPAKSSSVSALAVTINSPVLTPIANWLRPAQEADVIFPGLLYACNHISNMQVAL